MTPRTTTDEGGDACELRRKEFEKDRRRCAKFRFEKFVQENDAKRSRAEAKAKGEKRMFLQKVQEQKKGEDSWRLKVEKDKHALRLQKLSSYREFLERTVDAAGEDTEEVWDLLNRHDTLKSCEYGSTRASAGGREGRGRHASDLDALNLSAESAGLSRNRAVTGKRSSLEGFRTSEKPGRRARRPPRTRPKISMREEAQVVMAARNLYQRCVSTQRGMKVEGVRFDEWGDLDQKTRSKRLTDALELIGDRISDLTAIQREHTEEEREKAGWPRRGRGGPLIGSSSLRASARARHPLGLRVASCLAVIFVGCRTGSRPTRVRGRRRAPRPHRCGQPSCSRTPYMRRRKVA